jgi:PAS domain S-box-containing protein
MKKEGTPFWVQIEATVVLGDDGSPLCRTVISDISARKRAEAEMTKFQLIAQHARDPLLLVALDGKIVEFNQAAAKFYGYCREELLRLSIHDLRAIDSPGVVNHQMQQARSQGILFEAVHVCKDETFVPVEVNSRGVTVEGQEMLLSVIRDITERKQAEEALKQAHDELDVTERKLAEAELNRL